MQQTYFDRQVGEQRVQVFKTYDAGFARQAFESMDASAMRHLADSLLIQERYGPDDLPESIEELSELLWEETIDSAREEGQRSSFFVVTGASTDGNAPLYVSADWPSAGNFAESLYLG